MRQRMNKSTLLAKRITAELRGEYEKLKHPKSKRRYTTKADRIKEQRKATQRRIKTLPTKERKICKILSEYGEAVLSEIRLGKTVDEVEWTEKILAITEAE